MTRFSLLLLISAFSVLAAPVQADEVQEQIQVLLRGRGPDTVRAVERLRYLGAARSGPALRALLEHPSPAVRITASDALVRVLDPGSSRALGKALASDDDWEVRRNCADALGAVVAKSQRKALETALRRDTNRRVRKSSALALGKVGGGGRALAQSASKDPDLEVRLAALDAVARSLDRRAATSVRKLLGDSSSMIRFAAARALGWNGDAAGRRFLAESLEGDSDEEARRAVVVLATLPKSWAADLLLSASTRDSELGVDAARALAKREDERGLKALVRLSLSDGPWAESASTALDELGVDAARRATLSGARP